MKKEKTEYQRMEKLLNDQLKKYEELLETIEKLKK